MSPTDFGTALYYSTTWICFVTAWVYWHRLVVLHRLRGDGLPDTQRAWLIACGIVIGFMSAGLNELYFGYLRTFVMFPEYTIGQVLSNAAIKAGMILAGILHIHADKKGGTWRGMAGQTVAAYAVGLAIVATT